MDKEKNPEYSICPDCNGQIQKYNKTIYECRDCMAIFKMVNGELKYTKEYRESVQEDLEKADEVYQREIDIINTEIMLRQRKEKGE